MTFDQYEKEARRHTKKLLCGVLCVIAILLLASVLFCAVTYHHPIVFGAFPTADAEVHCMDYAHTLMGEFFGIPIHAQIIVVTEPYVYRLISLIPPWKTTVYASENDIPYWEHWN